MAAPECEPTRRPCIPTTMTPTLPPLPPSVHPVDGPGSLPMLRVGNALAQALVSLHGAQVLAFHPRHASADLLFLSDRAVYQPGKAIRGGVPVCWPWFGPDPQGMGRPAHGLARTRLWALRSASETPAGATRLTLGLCDSAETRAVWPHAFDLSLDITIGATLRLELRTRNSGDAPFDITQALHSYFLVTDIGQTRVQGLEGGRYIDKATGAGGVEREQLGEVVFAGEVDRIYTGTPARQAIVDAAGERAIGLVAEGSRTTVVWNPGPAIAAAMADLPDEAYRRFVCVETANAADEVLTVPPGGEHRLAVEIGLSGPDRGGSPPPSP